MTMLSSHALHDALGILGTVCFALMLAPQVYLNCSTRSTEGLSLPLIVLWHVSSLLAAAYYAVSDDSDTYGILSMMALAFFCGIVEAQFLSFRRKSQESRGVGFTMGAGILCLTALSALSYVALIQVMKPLADVVLFAVGDILPSVLLCVSFFPQIYEFVHRWSIKGYSFGVTFFDVCGCTANTVLIAGKPGLSFGDKIAHAAPFVSIIIMHCVLIVLAIAICSSGRGGATQVDLAESDAKP